MSFDLIRPRSLREESTTIVVLAVVALAGVGGSLWAAPGVPGYLGAALALVMLAIAAIDARAFIIPNELSAAGVLLGLVNAAMLSPAMWESVGIAVLRGLVIALFFYGLRALYFRIRGQQGLGLGDVKLAVVAGVWLDWLTIPIAVEIAALTALAAIGVRTYVLRAPLDTRLKFPFGLFLAPSIWVGWLLEATILRPF